MNVALLKRVKAWILKRPTQVYMDDFYSTLTDFGEPGGCGTAGCIAGIAVALSMEGPPAQCARLADPCYLASKALKLTIGQSERLFYTTTGNLGIQCWPEQFNDQLRKAKTPRGYARVVAKRIDHFIKTKGEE